MIKATLLRALDLFWPRYRIGVDPASGPEFATAVLFEHKRDGRIYVRGQTWAMCDLDLPLRWRWPRLFRFVDMIVVAAFGLAIGRAFVLMLRWSCP